VGEEGATGRDRSWWGAGGGCDDILLRKIGVLGSGTQWFVLEEQGSSLGLEEGDLGRWVILRKREDRLSDLGGGKAKFDVLRRTWMSVSLLVDVCWGDAGGRSRRRLR